MCTYNAKKQLLQKLEYQFQFITTVAGTNMWNDLPFHITSAQSLAVFRQRLKTLLFSRSYPDILI